MSLLVLHEPENFLSLLGKLPHGVTLKTSHPTFDMICYFVRAEKDLTDMIPFLKKSVAKTGMVWICWQKKSSGKASLDENIIREIGLSHGLVDVKVIAIDEEWSGLKFVYRLSDR